MAKVTLIIEDVEVNGKPSINMEGDFDDPGKSYDEMVAHPTSAVSYGLRILSLMAEEAEAFKGEIVDEFGTVVSLLK